MAKIIKPTDAIPQRPLSLVLMSDSGMGKTTAAFTANKCLLIAFEKGVERSYTEGRGDFVSYDQWADVKRELQNGEFAAMVRDGNYKTVAVDTIGTMIQSQITNYVISMGGKLATKGGTALSMDGWQVVTAEFVAFKTVLESLGVDMIFLAHVKGDGKEQKVDLDVQGGARGIITKHSDIIAYLSTDGRLQRWMEFDGTEDRVGKNPARLKKIAVPLCATTGAFPTFLNDEVFYKTRVAMFGQTEAQRKAAEMWKSLKSAIEAATDYVEVVAAYGRCGELPTSLQLSAIEACKAKCGDLFHTANLSKKIKAADLTRFALNYKTDAQGEIPEELLKGIGVRIMQRATELSYKFDKAAKGFVKADGTTEEDEETTTENETTAD